MTGQRGELHFVVKPTRLSVVRDVAVIAVCAVILAVVAVDLLRGESSAGALQVLARTVP
ncbi:MAG: hypothetical protein QM704_26575 [Anaeromyxobacteraceae bacterium]